MKKRLVFFTILLFTATCGMAKSKKHKEKPMPMPPLVSHGEKISHFACMYDETSTVAGDYWSVTAFAQYGEKNKQYWSKLLGMYPGNEGLADSNGTSENSMSGAPVGVMTEQLNVANGAQKKCAEWKEAVYKLVQASKPAAAAAGTPKKQ